MYDSIKDWINDLENRGAKYFNAYNYTTELPKNITDGICMVFDKNEKRVVYIGTHRENGNLHKRLEQDFLGKGNCSMRKSIIDALSHKQKLPAFKKQAVNYIKENMNFVVITIGNRNKRHELWKHLIVACVQDTNNQPSPNWLGKYSNDISIRNGKLWNKICLKGKTLDSKDYELLNANILLK